MPYNSNTIKDTLLEIFDYIFQIDLMNYLIQVKRDLG